MKLLHPLGVRELLRELNERPPDCVADFRTSGRWLVIDYPDIHTIRLDSCIMDTIACDNDCIIIEAGDLAAVSRTQSSEIANEVISNVAPYTRLGAMNRNAYEWAKCRLRGTRPTPIMLYGNDAVYIVKTEGDDVLRSGSFACSVSSLQRYVDARVMLPLPSGPLDPFFAMLAAAGYQREDPTALAKRICEYESKRAHE